MRLSSLSGGPPIGFAPFVCGAVLYMGSIVVATSARAPDALLMLISLGGGGVLAAVSGRRATLLLPWIMWCLWLVVVADDYQTLPGEPGATFGAIVLAFLALFADLLILIALLGRGAVFGSQNSPRPRGASR